MKSLTPDLTEFRIDSIAAGGDGVGRSDGLVVFVPYTAPGDLVRVRVEDRRKRFARGALVELLEPGPHRRTAPCPVYGKCGGCSLQHITESAQREAKRRIIVDSLVRIGRWPKEQTESLLVKSSPLQWGYRNRVQVHVERVLGGPSRVGFKAKASHEFVPIESCLIADHRLNDRLADVSKMAPGRYEMSLREDGAVEISASQVSTEARFSQVNSGGNEVLRDAVAELIQSLRVAPTHAWDLYAGSGNFSGFLSSHAKVSDLQWTAVEGSSASVELGRRLYPSLRWQNADVRTWLQNQPTAPGLVVVDPPRDGIGESGAQRLADLRPLNLIYISCDPGSLARDLQPFRASGYRLASLQAVDLFPQTDHIETVAHLQL